MNARFLDALNCRNQGRPPVWLMRQAGRYMPEYRALREKHSFLNMCHQPELVVEITQMPIKAFGFDAAIVFSDILVVAEAFGVGLRFEDKVGPIIEHPTRTAEAISQLPLIDVKEKLGYVAESIRQLKKVLKVPLIGFCGAPFTVASYMIEGGSSKTLRETKKWMLSNPQTFHELLDKITTATIEYVRMQVEAGADAIQIFDSWANYLAYPQFQEFSKAYLKKITDAVKAASKPTILFCKGSSAYAYELAQLSPAGISIDWNAHLPSIRRTIPYPIALQGNLDPDVLYAPTHVIRKEVRRLLDEMKSDEGFIFNLGHGILPDIPVESVKTLVETIRE